MHVSFLIHFFRIFNFLISFFPFHCIITKGYYLFCIYLIFSQKQHFSKADTSRSVTLPEVLTLLSPFPIARTMNNQILVCVQYFGINVVFSLSSGDFVSAPSKSSTLLCPFITESFKILFSHFLYPQACSCDGQQDLLGFISLFLYS